MPQLVGPFIDWWVFKLFLPLALVYSVTINVRAHDLLEYLPSVLLSAYKGIELLMHVIILYFTF